MSTQQIIDAAPVLCEDDPKIDITKAHGGVTHVICDGENIRYLCAKCAGAALLNFVTHNYTLLTTCPTMESDSIQVIEVE